MSRNLKMLVASVMVMLFVGNGVCTSAAQNIEPRVHEVCGGLAYHKMISHGWGTVYKNGTIVLNGCPTWQCKNCGRIMVTQGDIYLGEMSAIGNYAILHGQEPLNGIYTYVYEADFYGYTSSNSLDGYKFFTSNK